MLQPRYVVNMYTVHTARTLYIQHVGVCSLRCTTGDTETKDGFLTSYVVYSVSLKMELKIYTTDLLIALCHGDHIQITEVYI